MIENPLVYLLTLALIASGFYFLEEKIKHKIFTYLPSVVMIYAFSMFLASMGAFAQNDAIHDIYKLAKTNLLPAMLFLILLQVDLRDFVKLGRKLLLAYVLAVVSIAVGFIAVVYLFGFDKMIASSFGALAGSWMGGTANMVAVGSALGVSEEAFGYALVVDSVNYTIWVVFLLFLTPFASYFNRWSKAQDSLQTLGSIGCSCTVGAKRYWFLVVLAIAISFISQMLATQFTILNTTTTIVVLATVFGILGSFTKLREVGGSAEIATTMLYILVALIGSQAVIESFWSVGLYVLAGFMILAIHFVLMALGAKLFKLDLFSIAVASLSNIGGVASAPILAATYDKKLVGIGVLMAIAGYIIGTFGGLFVGNVLIGIAQ
ncbi:DUF819 family protein [Sulfurimonas sp. C5]|uniref:DUF819 family protein n=1 Tax=Sulfurimonas sp. C5 TaxID=3036947 RepID=UPI002456B6DA|nr:DUF819 family protein [Sulfurimonas sp. C5]MDH4945252.1 DUF819 family protein [Sulfurimonas sp. C5]